MLEVVRQKFHALPSSAQQQINESDSFRVMFIEEVSKELDMSPDEIGGYLSIVVAASNQDLDSLLEMVSIGGVQEEGIRQMAEADNNRQYIDWHNEMVLLPQAKALVVRAKMENGLSYNQAKDSINEEELRSVMQMLISKKRCFFPRPENVEKKDKKESLLLTEIENLLEQKSPLNKTQILTILGKDNQSYRDTANNVLYYLCFTQRARKVNDKYYHISKAPTIYETDIHRRVYEALCDGKSSVSAIAKHISYDNTRGRKRVKTILNLLEVEGLIKPNNTNNRYQEWLIPN
tara:strand:+ start:726 stop:1598 length:873 start_codon:yes stop_codon:yes gene_type:complete